MKKLIFVIFIFISATLYSQSVWKHSNIGDFYSWGDPYIGNASFISAENGVAILYDLQTDNKISIYKTLGKQSGWINATGDFSPSLTTVNYPATKFINANTGFIVRTIIYQDNYYLQVHKTTNAGINTSGNNAHWIELPGLYSWCPYMPEPQIEFTDCNTGYINSLYTVYKTTNCGNNWVPIFIFNDNDKYLIYDLKVSPINPNIIYLGGGQFDQYNNYEPCLIKSTNGGANWELYASGSNNGALGIYSMDIQIDNEDLEIIRMTVKNGVAIYNNGKIDLIADLGALPGSYENLKFVDQNNGNLTCAFYEGTLWRFHVMRTSNGGYNWNSEYSGYNESLKVPSRGVSKFGDVIFLPGVYSYQANNKNLFVDIRSIKMNILAKNNFSDEINTTIKFNVFDYPESYNDLQSPTYHKQLFGGTIKLGISQNSTPGDNYVFYKWIDYFSSQNPMTTDSLYNYYADKNGYYLTADYKTRQVSTTPNAISEKTSAVNSPQIRMIKDNNGYIHQIHESMGGIFYTRSTNDGTNWFKEEVVNGGSEYLQGFPSENTTDNNSCPAICELRTLNGAGGPFPLSDANINASASWQRFNNGIMELKVAFRQNNGNDIFWRRYGTSGYYQTHNGIIRSFTVSSQDYKSKPSIFAAWYDFPWGEPYYQNSDKNNPIDYMILIPHLEPATTRNKLVVSARLRNYPFFDFISNQTVQNNTFIIEESDITDFSVTSKPFIDGVYRGFILYFTYIKNGNIMYRADKFVTISGSPPGFARISYDDDANNNHASFNISVNDGQLTRISPDISLRNGRPIVTYRATSVIQKIVIVPSGEDFALSYMNYPIFVKYKYLNSSNQEVWSTPIIYNSAGVEQKNPNVEGCRNGYAYVLNYNYNNQYRQVAQLQTGAGYCIPGQYTVNDAKLVRGSFYGTAYPYSYPILLTLTQSASLYNIGKQTFSVSNIPSNSTVQDNLVGIIREENTNYNFNLGPVIAKNTNVTFATESEKSVTNAVEFSNILVSAPFSLGPNDTLILGGNGFYNYISGNPFLQKRYSVFLMRNSTQEPFMTLYSDSIGVNDTIETEYLRGYVFSEGEMPEVDSFYVQMVIDSTSLYQGDGFSVCNAYSPDELFEGDGPNSYKSRVHFIKGNYLNNISNIPKEYSLSQNYPNPFNPVTNIKYQIPVNGLVSLKIYDIIGREIANLVNEYKQAGYYTVLFNGSSFASGVYFYRIQAGNFVQVKKMVLIK